VSNTQQHQPHTTVELPDRFDTSGTKLIYLYLRIENEATIDELQAALGMKKLTLYSLLQTLTSTDHVDREGARYVSQEQIPAGGDP
jgi:predicted transcriptional regulator